MDMGARRALAQEEAPKDVVANAAASLHHQRSGATAAMGRWVQTAASPPGRGDDAIPTPQHRETERMECSPEARSARKHGGLLGRIWSPQLGLTSTLAWSGARAWRAGCRETCTSGSVRGMKRLVTAR